MHQNASLPDKNQKIVNCKFRGQKVNITRSINAHIVNAQYLLKGKAYEL